MIFRIIEFILQILVIFWIFFFRMITIPHSAVGDFLQILSNSRLQRFGKKTNYFIKEGEMFSLLAIYVSKMCKKTIEVKETSSG